MQKMSHGSQLFKKANIMCLTADFRSLMLVLEEDPGAMFPYFQNALGLELCFLEHAEVQDTRKQVEPGSWQRDPCSPHSLCTFPDRPVPLTEDVVGNHSHNGQ